MTKSDSKGGGNQGNKGIAMDGSHLKVPRNDTAVPVKFRDASHQKVPPKPSTMNKPDK